MKTGMGRKIIYGGLCGCFLLTVGSTAADAALVGATGAGVIAALPVSLDNGDYESDTAIFGFDEQQNFSLTSPLAVDNLIIAHDLDTTLSGIDVGDFGTGDTDGDLAPGTYSSHLIHFDPVNANDGGFFLGPASFTFDGDIVALIFSNELLTASDSIFGMAGTDYRQFPNLGGIGDNRRVESTDDMFRIFSADPTTLVIDQLKISTWWMDEMRVITTPASQADPVPEPATMILFGTGLAGLTGLRARRRKKA